MVISVSIVNISKTVKYRANNTSAQSEVSESGGAESGDAESSNAEFGGAESSAAASGCGGAQFHGAESGGSDFRLRSLVLISFEMKVPLIFKPIRSPFLKL